MRAELLEPPRGKRGVPPWLPNAVSSLRIALVPVWLVLALEARRRALTSGEGVDRLPLLALLLILGGSDLLDGWLARRFALTSNLGATLDAVADKLMQVATVTLFTFGAAPLFSPLPIWLWVALLARDVLLGIGWVTLWVRHQRVEAEHRWHGRAASLWLFALVVAATAAAPALWVTLGSAVALAWVIPSTLAYLLQGGRQLRS